MVAAETLLDGGTDYETPLREALHLMEEESFENADVVFITEYPFYHTPPTRLAHIISSLLVCFLQPWTSHSPSWKAR